MLVSCTATAAGSCLLGSSIDSPYLTSLIVSLVNLRNVFGDWIWPATGFLVGLFAGLFTSSFGRTPNQLAIVGAFVGAAALYACDPFDRLLDVATGILRYALIAAVTAALVLFVRFLGRLGLAGDSLHCPPWGHGLRRKP